MVALHQSQGRGRQNRTWVDEPGDSLLMSSMFLNTSLELGLIPLLAGMALAEVAGSYIEEEVELKWPNDLLINGHKLAGILVEARTRGDETWVVVGTGMNRVTPKIEGVSATSFADYATPPSVDELAAEVLAAIDSKLTWAESVPSGVVAQAYEKKCILIGKQVSGVGTDETEISGTAVGVEESGALLVDVADSGLASFAAGDVHLASG